MIKIQIPVSAVIGSGALSAVTGEFLKMGIQALGTNAEGLSNYQADLNKFSYEQIFNGSPSLYDSILALGGTVEFLRKGSEIQYFKAPLSYKTRAIPSDYPKATYTDENEVEQSYTYGYYHFHSGQPPYTNEDGTYIYFNASVWDGARAAFGLEVKALIDDGCILVSKEEFISLFNTNEI